MTPTRPAPRRLPRARPRRAPRRHASGLVAALTSLALVGSCHDRGGGTDAAVSPEVCASQCPTLAARCEGFTLDCGTVCKAIDEDTLSCLAKVPCTEGAQAACFRHDSGAAGSAATMQASCTGQCLYFYGSVCLDQAKYETCDSVCASNNTVDWSCLLQSQCLPTTEESCLAQMGQGGSVAGSGGLGADLAGSGG